MKELSLTERFALIGLNGKESEHWNLAKHYVLKAIAVASYLEDSYDSINDTWRFDSDGIHKAIKKNRMKAVEKQITAQLMKKHMLKKVKSLLGCDLFYNGNIKIKEYVSDNKEFENQIDFLKAEFLEEGPVSEEGLVLVWLLKNSSCINEVFSFPEQMKIDKKIGGLSKDSLLAKNLFAIDIRPAWGTLASGFLWMKSQFASTALGRGIVFIFPNLERKQSVFIDTEEYFSSAAKRLNCVIERVTSQGHSCEVLRASDVPLVKIDNIRYEAIPDAVVVKFPIHGVRLRRYGS
ncbi:MAG: hypothetical protein E7255_09180 [Lachnospiraceae bacterium]|jgi:hypothetical protein|nr:hypothetical protein [Lachnospiraceae bacterium]